MLVGIVLSIVGNWLKYHFWNEASFAQKKKHWSSNFWKKSTTKEINVFFKDTTLWTILKLTDDKKKL